MKNIDRIRKELSPARRRKIAVRAATLIAEERSLQELRQAHKLTQKKMAEVLGIGQDSVSRLEQRSDLLASSGLGVCQ
jgi:DNA-binding XRE family transcriptional regulator